MGLTENNKKQLICFGFGLFGLIRRGGARAETSNRKGEAVDVIWYVDLVSLGPRWELSEQIAEPPLSIFQVGVADTDALVSVSTLKTFKS